MTLAAFVVGRLLFGAFFLRHGVDHFRHASAMAQYARMKGVPAPGPAVLGTGAMLVVGGLSILLGWRPELGVSLLVLFLVPVALVMHNYWTVTDPQMRVMERVNFEKNFALAAAALMLLAVPRPWPLGLG